MLIKLKFWQKLDTFEVFKQERHFSAHEFCMKENTDSLGFQV